MTKAYIIYVMPTGVFFINTETYETIKRMSVKIECADDFKQDFQHLINSTKMDGDSIKAVVFGWFAPKLKAKSLDFYLYRMELYKYFEKQGIFCYFSSFVCMDVMATARGFQGLDYIGIGENILIISILFPPYKCMVITKEKVFCKVSGCIEMPAGKISSQWMNDVVQEYKPKQVIIQYLAVVPGQPFDDDCVQNVVDLFKSFNPQIQWIYDIALHTSRVVVDKVLHIMGIKEEKFTLAVPPMGIFELNDGFESLIETSELVDIPFEKCLVLENYSDKTLTLNYASYKQRNLERIKSIPLAYFKTKKIKVIFKLDENSFYDLKVEPMEDVEHEWNDSIQNDILKTSACILSDNIAELSVENGPEYFKMIFTKTNFSLHVVLDGKDKVLEDVDGLSKTPIFIAFKEDPPNIGQKARKVFEEAPECVVFDLIHLCSVKTLEAIEFDPKWKFTLSDAEKEDPGALFLVFKSVKKSEERKMATPVFLLALILKNAIQRVKKEIGQSLKKIKVDFFGFYPNEILKKNFLAAAELLNSEISFD